MEQAGAFALAGRRSHRRHTVPGSSSACTGDDQRDVPYVQGGAHACDAGAYQVAPPTLASVSAASAPSGTQITLTGTNLDNVTALTFGSAAAPAVIDGYNATTLTVTVPALAPGSQSITVTNLDGSATTAFSVPPPVITIDGFTAKPKKSKFTVQLSCTVEPCTGTITLTKSERRKVKQGKHKVWKTKTVVLAKNIYQLTPGASSTPTTDLSKSADKALKAARKHPLTLTVTLTDGTTATLRVT